MVRVTQETMTAEQYRLEAGKSRDESESAIVRRLFLFHIKARKLPVPRSKEHPEGEVVFMEGEHVQRHTKRRKLKTNKSPKWAFDFAWPEQRIAVEVEGVSVVRAGKMFLIGGRHGTIEGFKEDCEKYAWAAVMGWRVLRFEQTQVKAGLAVDMLVRMFAAMADSACMAVDGQPPPVRPPPSADQWPREVLAIERNGPPYEFNSTRTCER